MNKPLKVLLVGLVLNIAWLAVFVFVMWLFQNGTGV